VRYGAAAAVARWALDIVGGMRWRVAARGVVRGPHATNVPDVLAVAARHVDDV
jgi:hypothetical protein